MGRSLLLAILTLTLAAVPAGSGRVPQDQPDGILVMAILSPERAMVADPRTGARQSHRLAGGTLCHGPVVAVGGHVVFGGLRGRRAVALALPLSPRGPTRALGQADAFLPSATPGRLWLIQWPGSSKRWSNRPVRMTLREVDATGKVTQRAQGLSPRFAALHAALPEGFVGSEGRRLTLRPAGSGRPLLRIRDGWFAAAGRSSFAWCRGHCDALHVWTGGEGRILRAPAGAQGLQAAGALSADERWLATPVGGRGRPRIGVVDVLTGRWIAVPGARLGDYRAMAWSPSGRWLYFVAPDERPRAWRLGSGRVARLPIRPGGTVMSIVTAAGGR